MEGCYIAIAGDCFQSYIFYKHFKQIWFMSLFIKVFKVTKK